MHLKTAWRGNTFSTSEPRPGKFQSPSGLRNVTLLDSEQAEYFYLKTDSFEAAALPGNTAYMVVILPAPGHSIREVEQMMVEHPEALDAMKKEFGRVTIPVFRMSYESELGSSIQALGIHHPFRDLEGMIDISGSHLTRIAQRVDVRVDKEGIIANAETVAGVRVRWDLDRPTAIPHGTGSSIPVSCSRPDHERSAAYGSADGSR
jgi:serine protease inhibitor